jgi:hypothetical protein
VAAVSYFRLEPLVAGGLGPGTGLDASRHPPVVHTLVYEFEQRAPDDLVESFPVHLVLSEELAQALERTTLQGFGAGLLARR